MHTLSTSPQISSVAESSGGLPPSPLPVVMSPAPVSGAVAAPSASAAPAGPRKSSLSLQPESEQATQAEDRSNSQELMQVRRTYQSVFCTYIHMNCSRVIRIV